MSEQDITEGKARFRPRARIIRTLGRELIQNQFVAIQELVKNSYDADARSVAIAFGGNLREGDGSIEIRDDGAGMTLATVQTAWMEPATPWKLSRSTSPGGRRVTGEKGIGRFASARLSKQLEIDSVSSENGKRVKVKINWGDFDDADKFLDEVECSWREEPAPAPFHAGTVLRLTSLNDDWGDSDENPCFSQLRDELARLVSTEEVKDFQITLELPKEFKAEAGPITPPSILSRPRYLLRGRVGKDGAIHASFEGPVGYGPVVDDDGSTRILRLEKGRLPTCGPFSFEFRAWDLGQDDLDALALALGSTRRDLRRDLKSAAGVSIYRDRFRVLLPQTDWLGLDLRRVQNPTMRLSNNQIVGRVAISKDENRELVDQSNRQGIVDSDAFDDLKSCVIQLITIIEVKRRLAKEDVRAASPAGIFQKLDMSQLRDYASSKYPADADLRGLIARTSGVLSQGVEEAKAVISRYRRLATMGQLVDVMLHDGRTPLTAIGAQVELIRSDMAYGDNDRLRQRLPVHVKNIENQTENLGILLNRLKPFSGRRRSKEDRFILEDVIRNAFSFFRGEIKSLKVDVELPTANTPMIGVEGDFQMAFHNLIENALYWLSKVDEHSRKIVVKLNWPTDTLKITFSDSGPGVSKEIQDRIWEPYFTTRSEEGVGLGLTIVGETVVENGGTVDLVEDGPLDGATFRITLPYRHPREVKE